MNPFIRRLIAFAAGVVVGMVLTVIGYPARAVFRSIDCTKPVIDYPDDRYFAPAERLPNPNNRT